MFHNIQTWQSLNNRLLRYELVDALIERLLTLDFSAPKVVTYWPATAYTR
jgi:hypothetical protein